MADSDSYGEPFGRRLNAHATTFATRALPRATIAVTELRYENPQHILSTPPIREDAFLVAVHLKHFPRYEYWENGKAAPVSVLRPGDTIIYDIKRAPIFHLNSAFHSVHFYLSRAALNSFAQDAEAPRIDELRYKPAVSHADPVLRDMALALLPLFREPDRANQLFMDHFMLAVGHHVAWRYGEMRPTTKPVVGGLAPHQERRAKELLTQNISGDIPLAAVARECGLSLTHFSKAFRRSVGVPPHQWLLRQRVALAERLLREFEMSLAEIALACGFSHQSHFTRFFSATVGASPGLWRRSIRS